MWKRLISSGSRIQRTYATMTSTLTFHPIPIPPSANATYFKDVGKRVEGFDPATVTPEQLKEIQDALYKVSPDGTTLKVAFHLVV